MQQNAATELLLLQTQQAQFSFTCNKLAQAGASKINATPATAKKALLPRIMMPPRRNKPINK
jgi:hypothetical protein